MHEVPAPGELPPVALALGLALGASIPEAPTPRVPRQAQVLMPMVPRQAQVPRLRVPR